MSACLFTLGGALLVAAVLMFAWQWGRDAYPHYSIWRGIIAIACLLVGLAAVLVPTTVEISRAATRRHCNSFERQTGRTTEFMQFTWVSFDCMVQTESGWVSLDAVMGVEETRE